MKIPKQWFVVRFDKNILCVKVDLRKPLVFHDDSNICAEWKSKKH